LCPPAFPLASAMVQCVNFHLFPDSVPSYQLVTIFPHCAGSDFPSAGNFFPPLPMSLSLQFRRPSPSLLDGFILLVVNAAPHRCFPTRLPVLPLAGVLVPPLNSFAFLPYRVCYILPISLPVEFFCRLSIPFHRFS